MQMQLKNISKVRRIAYALSVVAAIIYLSITAQNEEHLSIRIWLLYALSGITLGDWLVKAITGQVAATDMSKPIKDGPEKMDGSLEGKSSEYIRGWRSAKNAVDFGYEPSTLMRSCENAIDNNTDFDKGWMAFLKIHIQ